MPLYEYLCESCRQKFELLVQPGQENDLTCPHCQGKKLKKLCSSFGIGGNSNRLQTSSSACQSCTSKSCSTCKS
ncbi:MAG: hypothetical protein DRI99_07635 [Candidatus Aminicenantes bacterium]|nr:MAG: hypothetical protein DRI99_07635 [Candidatus Aminicenantes bacterium]